ncbi:hypothetical protein ACIGO6_36740 [Streptomyces sp. NPDC053750]|uniref:hypothetical protein n=1 Tax=Streptomyces sp. NPDC053750 TaxID=3365714 RepID=UPI0037D2FC59
MRLRRLAAVILFKAMILIVVLVALPTRLGAVSASEAAAHRPIAINLLAGSLLGAWAGGSWAESWQASTSGKS